MANNKVNIDKGCLVFFARLQNVDYKSKEGIYNEAVIRAYRDMAAHTLHYKEEYKGKNKDELKKKLKKNLSKLFYNEENTFLRIESIEEFDKWHKKLRDELKEFFCNDESEKREFEFAPAEEFTDGQAQKLINMTIKYVYIFYNYSNALDNKLFNSIINFLHTPIDSIVIKHCNVKNNNNKKSKTDIKKWEFDKKEKVAWSKLNSDQYEKIVDWLRKNVVKDGNIFMWELKNWPFGEEDEERYDWLNNV